MIRTMSFVMTRDADEFAAHTQPLLTGRIECNVMATVLINLRQSAYGNEGARFAYSLDDAGGPTGAAMRVPPWPLLTSPLAQAAAAELARRWLEHDPQVPGVVGLPACAGAIADTWARSAGGRTHIRMRQAMHELQTVRDPPRPTRGDLRRADEHDRGILIEWMRAFAQEAGVPGADDTERMIDARLRMGGLAVWYDDGPTSMIGIQPQVAGVVRIGPVYTPPEYRRRGFAGAAVAAASRRALAAGAEKCMLFTDLANPTSNKIYAEVGYRPIAEWEEHEFERVDPAGAT